MISTASYLGRLPVSYDPAVVRIHTSFEQTVALKSAKWPILARANVWDGPNRKKALAEATVAVRKHRSKEKFFVYGWETLGRRIDRATVPDFVPRFAGTFIESEHDLPETILTVATAINHPDLAKAALEALRDKAKVATQET